jgi:hypothetical protein
MNANDQMTESIAKATKHRWANSWRAAAGPLSSLQLLRSHDNERSREGETEEHPFIGDEQTDDRPESPLFRISSTSSGSSSPSSLHPLHKQMEDEEHLSQASWCQVPLAIVTWKRAERSRLRARSSTQENKPKAPTV